MAGGGSRWASQAAQDAMLRFGPQRGALAEGLQQAQEAYGSTVRAGNQTAKLTAQAAQRAIPQIGQIYGQADAAQRAGTTLLSGDLAALPGVANTYKANQASEVQQQLSNLIGARSRDEAMLAQQPVQAAAGAQFNQLNARQALQHTIAGLIAKNNAITGEQGAFAASEAQKLAHEAETLEQRERASERTAGTSLANNQLTNATSRESNIRTTSTTKADTEANNQRAIEVANKHGGRAGPHFTAPGVKEQSVQAHNQARDTIEAIRHTAFYNSRMNSHLNYDQALQSLQTAVKAKGFSRKAYPDNGLLRAGLDLAYFGGVGTGTAEMLHREGYGVGRLGYPIYHAPGQPPQQAVGLVRAGLQHR